METIEKVFIHAFENAFKTVNTHNIKYDDTISWELGIILADYVNTENKKNEVAEIQCDFNYNYRYKSDQLPFDYQCIYRFRNLKPNAIEKLFEDNNYNYEIVEKVINEFHQLGEKYKLFKSKRPTKGLKIHDCLSVNENKEKGRELVLYDMPKNISNIKFANFYKTDIHKAPIHAKKLKGKNLSLRYIIVVKNNELHPIVMIDFPTFPNASMNIILDIHPDHKAESEAIYKEKYAEFEKILQNKVNQILRKELDLDNKLINKLSLEDKIDYLTIAEMAEI